jgi:hypothetical protein
MTRFRRRLRVEFIAEQPATPGLWPERDHAVSDWCRFDRRYGVLVSEANQQPTEQEIREYLSRLRTAPAGQVVPEILYGLLNAAQAKLGRRDGRLMIDLSGLVLDHARPHLPAAEVTQLDQLLAQLRISQVRAENELATKGEAEPNDLSEMPTPPQTTQPAAQQPPAPKLWVPGRNL